MKYTPVEIILFVVSQVVYRAYTMLHVERIIADTAAKEDRLLPYNANSTYFVKLINSLILGIDDPMKCIHIFRIEAH